MEAAEVNGICFSLFIANNHLSVEFNYYCFSFLLKMLLDGGKQPFV